MGRLSSPRHRLAGFAFLLSLGVLMALAAPAFADYLGPNRTVSVWEWERLQCHYEAIYDPPGVGWYGCTLDLHDTPDASCPSTGSVTAFFNPTGCPGWPGSCTTLPCSISLSASVGGCSEGETGCTAVERTTTLPEATVSGSLSCAVPGAGGWCLAGTDLSLTGSEPLAGYSILALEGTRNSIPGGGGGTFACPGDACAVPLLEGTNDFTFWAISSWGDTSRMGAASGRLDSEAPVISGELSGITGDNGWYVSHVAFSASSSDPSPGSGLLSFDLSLDGGAWAAYTGPLTLSDGSHTVDLRADDAAGNTSTQSQAVRVDTQPPTLDLSAADGFCPGCGEVLEVTLDVQDSLSGVVEWTLSADGIQIAGGGGPTSQTITWDGAGLPAGTQALALQAWDAAGNTQDTSQAVTLLVPAPPPVSNTPSQPISTPLVAASTMTSVPTGTPTRTSQPTRTASSSSFGGLPIAPLAPEASPPADSPLEPEGAPPPAVEGPSSGVLWGVAALALIGSATAIALDQARRRKEEEARQRAEMERRNAAQRAREEAERRSLAAVLAAAAAAAAEAARRVRDRWFERREQRWEEQEIAATERAEAEARAQREAEDQARRLAAATAQMERLRAIAEGRDASHIGRATASNEEPTILDQAIRIVSPFLEHAALEAPIQREYRIPLLPTSQVTSSEYLIRYSVRLRSPTEAPSAVVDPATPRVSVPFLGGSWSYSFRDGAISITRVLPWSLPVPGIEDSIAQVRWSTTWGIGTYGGELGVRQALNLDSRVVIADRELSNTSASLMSTTRFRPENLLLQAAVGLLAILTFTVGTAAIGLLGAGTADLLGNLLPNFGR
jgi:hypothetical protein